MKTFKLIQSIIAIIPFAWFVSFLLMLSIATIRLGHIPAYGIQADPDALGFQLLSFMHFFLFVFGLIAFFLWIAGFVAAMVFFRKEPPINKLTTVLFLVGVAGFHIFKYGFAEQFAWMFD